MPKVNSTVLYALKIVQKANLILSDLTVIRNEEKKKLGQSYTKNLLPGVTVTVELLSLNFPVTLFLH